MVVGPTPTDPVEFRKCARDLKVMGAAKEHTNEERGGGRDPGVRRPGAGRGQFIVTTGDSLDTLFLFSAILFRSLVQI